MQTFLILSKNPSFVEEEIKRLTKNLNISSFDTYETGVDASLGISEVRSVISGSSAKPYSGTHSLTVIRNFHNATPEAQNALLKYLEETPSHHINILQSDSSRNILPTIISRCQIVSEIKKSINRDTGILDSVLKLNHSGRIVWLQKNITSKDQALEFLDNLLTGLARGLQKEQFHGIKRIDLADMIKKTRSAARSIEGNLNYKMALDILLLGFPLLAPEG